MEQWQMLQERFKQIDDGLADEMTDAYESPRRKSSMIVCREAISKEN